MLRPLTLRHIRLQYLLEYWARAVEDPGMELAKWTYQGAPAGIECQTLELDGVCPRVDDTEQQASVDLSTDKDTFENYEGVEDDSEAAVAIDQYLSKGYLMKFDTLEELQQFVGGQPVLSKLGCIKKMEVQSRHQAVHSQGSNHSGLQAVKCFCEGIADTQVSAS